MSAPISPDAPPSPVAAPPPGGETAIAVRGLSYSYPGAPGPALDGVSLTIPAGGAFGLVGPNGAGKSTLISLMTGARKLQGGEIDILGTPLRADPARCRRLSALAPQELAFYPALTGRENLTFFLGAFGAPARDHAARRDRAVAMCGLEAVLDRPAGVYSGGLKRRLNLAIALLNAPRLLFLDEPTVGVDAHSRAQILKAIADLSREGATIIYTSHYMEEVEALCDRIAVIDGGRVLAQGAKAELLASAAGQTRIILTPGDNAAARTVLTAQGARLDSDGAFVLPIADARALGETIGALAAAGAGIARLEHGVTRLEQVYLRLVGAEGRA